MSLYCCMWVISRGAAICHPMHAFNSLWRCPPLPIQTLITTSLPFPPILSFLLTAPCRSYPFLPRSIPTPVILTLSLRAHSCPLTYLHSYPRTHCLTVSVSLSRCLSGIIYPSSYHTPSSRFRTSHCSLSTLFLLFRSSFSASFPPISLSPLIHLLPSLLYVSFPHTPSGSLTLPIAVTRILSLPVCLSSSIPHTTPLLPSHFPLLYSLPLCLTPSLYSHLLCLPGLSPLLPSSPLRSAPPPSAPLLSLHPLYSLLSLLLASPQPDRHRGQRTCAGRIRRCHTKYADICSF